MSELATRTRNGALTVVDDEDSMLGMMLQQQQASVGTAIQMAAAMLDKRISTARAYPRSITKFKREAAQLLSEDVETARAAEYAKPVGGGVVKGASIRLAELAAMCWGNLDVEVGEPIVGDKSVTVKATAWDLERNYRQEGLASTPIVKKNGERFPQHMIETVALSTVSKAKRNAIIAIIPRAYINDLLEVARKVANGNQKPLEQRRADALDFIARSYKVPAEAVYATLNVAGFDDLGEEHLDELRAILTAIKEGSAGPDEFFAVKGESKLDALKEKLDARKAKPVAATSPATAAATGTPSATAPATSAATATATASATPDPLLAIVADLDNLAPAETVDAEIRRINPELTSRKHFGRLSPLARSVLVTGLTAFKANLEAA